MIRFSSFILFAWVALSAPLTAEIITIQFSQAEGLNVRSLPAGNPPGTGSTDFTLSGASFTGGEVFFAGNPPLYASAPSSYGLGGAGGEINFATPVTDLSFFFVDSGPNAQFQATAFDEAGNSLGTVFSNNPTFLNDPNNFVSFGSQAQVSRVVLTGGVIDNVTFTPEPSTLALWGVCALVGWVGWRWHRRQRVRTVP